MDIHPQNRDETIQYNPVWDNYYFVISEEPKITQDIFFCPWCGTPLPESQFDAWHNELESLGIDWRTEEVPEKYRSAAWRTQH